MKTREQAQRAPKESDFSTNGKTIFRLWGFVQKVQRNEKMFCDYVMFNIKSRNNPDFFDIISVCVPDSLGICCERGDALTITGYVRSWNRSGGVALELVADKIEGMDPERLR